MNKTINAPLERYRDRIIIMSCDPLLGGLRYCVHIVDLTNDKVFARTGITKKLDARQCSTLFSGLLLYAQSQIDSYETKKFLAQHRAKLAKRSRNDNT